MGLLSQNASARETVSLDKARSTTVTDDAFCILEIDGPPLGETFKGREGEQKR